MSANRSGSPRGRLGQIGNDENHRASRSSSLRRRVPGVNNTGEITTPTSKQTAAAASSPALDLTPDLRKLANVGQPQTLTPELRALARMNKQPSAMKTPTRSTLMGSNPASQVRRSGGPRSTGKMTPSYKRAVDLRAHSRRRKNSRGSMYRQGDDIWDALKGISRIQQNTTRPYVPTPPVSSLKKATASSSAVKASRRSVRLEREGSETSDSDSDDIIKRTPKLSRMSLQAISQRGYDSDGELVDDDVNMELPPYREYSLPARSPTRSPEQARRAISERPPDLHQSLGIRYSFADYNDEESILLQQDESALQLHEESRLTLGEDETGIQLEEESMMYAADEQDETTFQFDEQTGEIPLPPDHFDEDTTRMLPLEDEYDNQDDIAAVPEIEAQPRRGAPAGRKRVRKQLPESQYGIPYPSLSTGLVKKLASTFSKSKLSAEAIKAIESATEEFFEQAGEDYGAMARHAKRKTIEESDVVQVMRRQRLIDDKTTIFSLAARHLPRELLQDIHITVQARNVLKKRRRTE